MTALSLLTDARGFVARGFCFGAKARDKRCKRVMPTSPDAVAWSAYGALMRAAGVGPASSGLLSAPFLIADGMLSDAKVYGMEEKEAVLAAFDKAIESLTQEAG